MSLSMVSWLSKLPRVQLNPEMELLGYEPLDDGTSSSLVPSCCHPLLHALLPLEPLLSVKP